MPTATFLKLLLDNLSRALAQSSKVSSTHLFRVRQCKFSILSKKSVFLRLKNKPQISTFNVLLCLFAEKTLLAYLLKQIQFAQHSTLSLYINVNQIQIEDVFMFFCCYQPMSWLCVQITKSNPSFLSCGLCLSSLKLSYT